MTWTRRDFIVTSALGLAAVSTPGRLFGVAGMDERFVAIRRNTGLFSARGGTIGWLANDAGALVVDSQYPDTASQFITAFAERGARSIDALVNTHHHGDHTGGNGAMRGAVGRIVAHTRAVELQQRANERSPDSAQPHADVSFEREWSTTVGDEVVRARHYGPAHTGGDVTVFFERANVVHMGDLVFNRAYPFVDRQGGASIDGWISLLESVVAEHDTDTIYIFGHARSGQPVTGGRADVLLQRDFLAAVLEAARRDVAAGRSREESTAVEQLPGFEDHASVASWLNLGAVMGAAWDEITGA